LPAEELDSLQEALSDQKPGAQIIGMLPLIEAIEDNQYGQSSFQIVSSIINDCTHTFTRSVVHSGHAPILPGSKAALAVKFSPAGASLFWRSLSTSTTDLSLSMKAYFKATTEAYHATIKASYRSLHQYLATQYSGIPFRRDDVRSVVDRLYEEGVFQVNVRKGNTDLVDIKQMEWMLQMLTDKVIDALFEPLITNKQSRGNRLFKGGDLGYILVDHQNIRQDSFYINLVQRASIQVPVIMAGALGPLPDSMLQDRKYIRNVHIDDPFFQTHTVRFQVAGDYLESFKDLINFGAVNVRKFYPKDSTYLVRRLTFSAETFRNDLFFQEVEFPSIGEDQSQQQGFEYYHYWSFKGRSGYQRIPDNDQWIESKEPFVSLVPPLDLHRVEVEIDPYLLEQNDVISCIIQFYSTILNERQKLGRVVLRPEGGEAIQKLTLFCDRGQAIFYEINWYAKTGKLLTEPKQLKNDYLLIIPPDEGVFKKP
jgi:hypothetical protein